MEEVAASVVAFVHVVVVTKFERLLVTIIVSCELSESTFEVRIEEFAVQVDHA